MKASKFVLPLLAATSLLQACTDQQADDFDDESDLTVEGEAKADSSDGNYYTVEPIRPTGFVPGGSPVPLTYRVRRANATTLRCSDGAVREFCSVSGLKLQVSADIQAVVDGKLNDFANRGRAALVVRGTLGTGAQLRGNAVWMNAAAASEALTTTGVTTRVVDSGVRCITTPCPVFREYKLNATSVGTLNGLTGAEALQATAVERIYDTQEGVIVMGPRSAAQGTRKVRALFVQPQSTVAPACDSLGGASRECADRADCEAIINSAGAQVCVAKS